MKGFLETDVNSQATGIVSFNRRDFALAPRQVGIPVLSPVGALSRLEQEQ